MADNVSVNGKIHRISSKSLVMMKNIEGRMLLIERRMWEVGAIEVGGFLCDSTPDLKKKMFHASHTEK